MKVTRIKHNLYQVSQILTRTAVWQPKYRSLPGLTDPDEDCSLATQIQIFTRSHRSSRGLQFGNPNTDLYQVSQILTRTAVWQPKYRSLPGLTDPDEDCSLATQIQIFTRSHRSSRGLQFGNPNTDLYQVSQILTRTAVWQPKYRSLPGLTDPDEDWSLATQIQIFTRSHRSSRGLQFGNPNTDLYQVSQILTRTAVWQPKYRSLPGLTDPDEDCSLATQIQIFTRSHRSSRGLQFGNPNTDLYQVSQILTGTAVWQPKYISLPGLTDPDEDCSLATQIQIFTRSHRS